MFTKLITVTHRLTDSFYTHLTAWEQRWLESWRGGRVTTGETLHIWVFSTYLYQSFVNLYLLRLKKSWFRRWGKCGYIETTRCSPEDWMCFNTGKDTEVIFLEVHNICYEFQGLPLCLRVQFPVLYLFVSRFATQST